MSYIYVDNRLVVQRGRPIVYMSGVKSEEASFCSRFFVSRRWQDGHHIEDWLRAEQELVAALRVTAKHRPIHTAH